MLLLPGHVTAAPAAGAAVAAVYLAAGVVAAGVVAAAAATMYLALVVACEQLEDAIT